MRDVVVKMHVSLDGFVGTPDGGVDWAFPRFDDEYTAWQVDALWQAGVHVMGAETGRGLAEYWPAASDPRDLPFAGPMNEIPKVVFSKSIDHLDWNQTRIARGPLAEEIGSLKAEAGADPSKHILVHGGARFVQALARERLVDRYQLTIHPVALGGGLPLFAEMEPLELELVERRPFAKGAVLHVYRPM